MKQHVFLLVQKVMSHDTQSFQLTFKDRHPRCLLEPKVMIL